MPAVCWSIIDQQALHNVGLHWFDCPDGICLSLAKIAALNTDDFYFRH